MATYTFSLSTSHDARQAGLIQSTSFEEALRLVGERMTVSQGDTLEIGKLDALVVDDQLAAGSNVEVVAHGSHPIPTLNA